jgi:O-acetyl-ADP-ribose deacetylase (regulator of RNase III)
MSEIEVVKGDLLTQDVDVIVNAANTHLVHGAGVAGAIASAGGPSIQRESNAKRPIPTGAAATTTAGDLPFKAIVHAVGPVWGGGFDEDRLLRFAHKSAVIHAARVGAKSMAFPAISCGIFRFPIERAAPIAIQAVRDVLKVPALGVEEVRFVLMDDAIYDAYEKALRLT